MALTKSTDTGIAQRTNVYAARELLRHANAINILGNFGVVIRMPMNKSNTIKLRRPVTFTAATTPLVEGVTPNATTFGYVDVTGTLREHGQVVAITNVVEELHEDGVLDDMVRQLGENLGRTREALSYGVLRAGTNVFYANGTTRVAVNTPITLNKQRAVIRALKAQKAEKIRSMLDASINVGTRPIEASYIAVAHTDLEADVRGLPGFTPVVAYGTKSQVMAEEIGSVEDVRYILSPDLDPFLDAGGAKGSMVSTTGTSADVYPIMYFGRDAYGIVAMKGMGSVEPTVIPAGQKTKDDPLGQRGYAGWRTWFLAMRLNEAWMCRLEVAVTAL